MKTFRNAFFLINSFRIILLLSLSTLILTGCNNSIITKKAPSFSHIHLGHTLTGWRSTPDKQGLLITAEDELKIVLDNSSKAINSKTLAEKKQYMSNALHAVDPKIQTTGAGKGYGLTRALVGSISHLEYAATSDDTSANIKNTVPIITAKAQKMASASNQLKIFAQAALNASSMIEMDALLGEFSSTAQAIKKGDENGAYSLVQFRKDIQAMTDKERPAYTTVDSYYLFNLIRLKSGKWIISSTQQDATDDFGY
jgi:hypothetical protein